MRTPPTVILGAGLAGLSVARALLRERPSAPIVLVDRRSTWERDRTWCFWATTGLPDAALATAQWGTWTTVGPGGVHAQSSARHPYLHLPADRFYEASLRELTDARNVELMTDTRVLGVSGGGRGEHIVRTTRGELRAAAVVDAMGGRGPLLGDRPDGRIELRQQFLGQEVEVERPVFDPGTATLMDFRVPGPAGGVRFMYVLPFSTTRALVEDTSIGGPAIAGADRRQAIETYLGETLGAGSAHVLRTERGSLPMTTHPFPEARRAGVAAAGQAAGAARPSSGYAFVRTQRHATALAQSLLRGSPAPSALGPRRRRVLDAQFLRALQSAPETAPSWFLALARNLPGDVFARFMSDASTVADEARVLRALARRDFLTAVAGRSGSAQRYDAAAPLLVGRASA